MSLNADGDGPPASLPTADSVREILRRIMRLIAATVARRLHGKPESSKAGKAALGHIEREMRIRHN